MDEFVAIGIAAPGALPPYVAGENCFPYQIYKEEALWWGLEEGDVLPAESYREIVFEHSVLAFSKVRSETEARDRAAGEMKEYFGGE